ncbi:MAG: hypothetical protein ACRDZ3_04495 [Acidimicrobiia bacterium]
MLAVFTSASAAVECAVAMQQAVHRQDGTPADPPPSGSGWPWET